MLWSHAFRLSVARIGEFLVLLLLTLIRVERSTTHVYGCLVYFAAVSLLEAGSLSGCIGSIVHM